MTRRAERSTEKPVLDTARATSGAASLNDETMIDLQNRSIQPDAIYSTAEAAYLLGFRGKSKKAATNRVHEIPYEKLARVKTGPHGGKVGFLGRDLLAYINSCRLTTKSA